MIGVRKQLEVGWTAEDVARAVGVPKHKIYTWKAKYGGTGQNPGSLTGRTGSILVLGTNRSTNF
jgi:hypothetical protein